MPNAGVKVRTARSGMGRPEEARKAALVKLKPAAAASVVIETADSRMVQARSGVRVSASMPSENWTALTPSLSPRRGNLPSPRWEESLNAALIPSARQLRLPPEGEDELL